MLRTTETKVIKRFLIIFIIIAFLFFSISPVYAYVMMPEYLCELGLHFYQQGRLSLALHEFQKALIISPGYEPALRYINMIQEKPLVLPPVTVPPILKPPIEKPPIEKPPILKPPIKIREEAIQEMLDRIEKAILPPVVPLVVPLVVPPVEVPELKEKIPLAKKREVLEKAKILSLTDELWLTEPKPSLIMEIGKSLILKGKNIKRYLIVSPELLNIERIDKDNLILTASLRKGSTFLHIWDDKGRWTFPVSVVFPKGIFYPLAEEVQEGVQPFRFAYSADWSSYYRGKRIGTLNRESLGFSQWLGLFGDSPYGKFDASTVFTKFKESTEVTSYGVGLTDGKIGPFRDFNLRGFDQYKYFSSLSLPGTGLRGVSLQGKTFEDILAYDLLWGRTRVAYGFIAPGVEERRDEFIEGLRVSLFPFQPDNYSFNYTHGYGSAREEYLKDTVLSLETNQDIKDMKLSSECAFDGDSLAAYVNTRLSKDNLRFGLELRDIEKDFTTVVSRPGGQGEIGSRFTLDYKFSDVRLSSDLDVYRDRVFFNPAKPDELNFDWNTSLLIPLASSSDWQTGIYYTNTPGLLSPRRVTRINNTYSKRVKFLTDKTLSWFLGNSYQRSRFPLSPSSDYNRYTLFGGQSLPLVKNLYFSLDYEHSWAEAYLSGEDSSSGALRAGLNYNKQISPSWFANMNLSYRDEEDTEKPFSFLAGEDSLCTNVGLTYRPSPDFEFFLSGTLTNIWAENPARENFDNAYIRWGVRSSWDLLFSWNPQGKIKGIVYNDVNGNMEKDEDENGMPGIRVKVGKKEVVTDEKGEYSVTVRAKRLTVALDVDSIPENYILSTPSVHKIDIVHKKSYYVNFGLTTHSGVQGIVFYDKNKNGKPDAEDIFIPNAEIILNGKEISVTDTGGKFFFLNIVPGKHTLTINVNSLPLEYLPLVKVANEIEVREGETYIFHIPLKTKN